MSIISFLKLNHERFQGVVWSKSKTDVTCGIQTEEVVRNWRRWGLRWTKAVWRSVRPWLGGWPSARHHLRRWRRRRVAVAAAETEAIQPRSDRRSRTWWTAGSDSTRRDEKRRLPVSTPTLTFITRTRREFPVGAKPRGHLPPLAPADFFYPIILPLSHNISHIKSQTVFPG